MHRSPAIGGYNGLWWAVRPAHLWAHGLARIAM